MTDFQNPNSLRARTEATERDRKSADAMGWYLLLGKAILMLSALTTCVYFVIAVGEGWRGTLPAWAAYALGAVLGVLALGAGEIPAYRWAGVIVADNEINTAQRIVAAVCAVLAAVSAAVTSVIAITYFLPLSMPASWRDMQQIVNLANLAGGWTVVLVGGVAYTVVSSRSKVNALIADANNRVDEAAANVTRQLATRVEDGAEVALEQIDVSQEVVLLIAARLGLDAAATQRKLPAAAVTIPQPPETQPDDGAQLTGERVYVQPGEGEWYEDLNATAREVYDRDRQREEAERLARIGEQLNGRPTTRPAPNGNGGR